MQHKKYEYYGSVLLCAIQTSIQSECGVTLGGRGSGWLSSEAAKGSASDSVSENKPIFSSTVICQAPAISRMNCTHTCNERCDLTAHDAVITLHSESYLDFNSITSSEQPLPAGDGRLHALLREHLQRRPAEVMQQLKIPVWDRDVCVSLKHDLHSKRSIWSSGCYL